MWKEILLVGFASVALRQAEAVGGAESLPFHGFLPVEYIRSKQPRGDNQPNDVYQHLQPKAILQNDEDVYYPPTLIGFGLEHGQDPEERVYKVYSKQEVEELRRMQQSKHGKHAKGGKGGHHSKGDHGKAIHSKPAPPPPAPLHPQQPSLPHPPPQHIHHHSQERFPAPSSEHHISYPSHPPPPPQYHPKVVFPPSLPHRG